MSATVRYPDFATTAPGSVAIVTLQNAGAGALEGGVTVFGQSFAMGEVPAGARLTAVIDGVEVPVQLDVKNTHEDGSARMAVVSVLRPDLAAGEAAEAVLNLAGPSAMPAPTLSLADAVEGRAFTVDLAFDNGRTLAVDVLAELREALADGTASVWQQGPLAAQARVEVLVENSSMRLVFDVTAFQDGNISVDAQFRNDRAMEAVGGRLTYEAVIRMDGQEVGRESVSQAQYQAWRGEYASDAHNGGQGLGGPATGWLNIRHDVQKLAEIDAVPDYDLSIGINESTLQSYATAQAAEGWGDPLATNGVTQAMPMTGGRPDIGFTTMANASWLMSQDARAAGYALGQAETAGAVPWNFWDAANGTWLNTDAYPKLWVDPRGGTGRPGDATSTGLTQQVETHHTTGWQPDTAHQPDLSYVPYLLTGERWILDNLNAQASYNIMNQWPLRREDAADIVTNLVQVRAAGWSMRQIENAAWANPDGSTEQSYLREVAADNWAWLVSKIPEWTAAQGEAHGYLPFGVNHTMSPWMQDMFASAVILAAERGSEDALTLLEWMTNFLVGRFKAADQGFAFHDGVAYQLAMGDVATNSLYQTWEEIGAQTVARGLSLGDGWLPGYYNKLGLATLAGIHRVTGSQEALEVYRALVADSPTNTSLAGYRLEPQFAVTIPGLYAGTVLGTELADDVVLKVAAGTLNADLGDGADRLVLANGTNTGSVANVETLIGGSGNDVITFEAGPQRVAIDLGAGIDRLTLAGTTQTLADVANAETIEGGAAADDVRLASAVTAGRVDLGAGADRLALSGAGPNTLDVLNVETLTGGAAADTVTFRTALTGGVIDLQGGADRLVLSGAGPNSVSVAGAETVTGGLMADDVTLTTPVSGGSVDLGAGADRLALSGAGPNTLTLAGVETLLGGAAADSLTVTSQLNGSVDLGGGADRLALANFSNVVALANTEWVTGGTISDRLTVTDATPTRLEGGTGTDTLIGGSGADTLLGGAHGDLMTGGAGADRFLYTVAGDAAGDRITDFTLGTDLLVFSGLSAEVPIYRGALAFTASGRTEARMLDWTNQLQIDLDGNGTLDMAITLTGITSANMTASSILWNGTAALADGSQPVYAVTAGAAVAEGGAISFQVTRDRTATTTQTVTFSLGGTATAGTDYAAPATASVTFAAGDLARVVTLSSLADAVVEGTETVTLQLTGAGGASLSATARQATANLLDATPATVFSVTGGSVAEGGVASFTVARSADAAVAQSVTVTTVNGTAVAGQDFAALATTLTFLPGEMSRTVEVQTFADAVVEPQEDFALALSGATGGALIGGGGTAQMVLSDATPPVAFSVAAGPAVTEGAAMIFTVTRSADAGVAQAVSLATSDGTALAGIDYVPLATLLTFLPGELSKTVSVQVLADMLVEPNESFRVTLSAPTGGATLGTATAEAQIIGFSVINGGSGPDSIAGTMGTDSIRGLDGNDTMTAGMGGQDSLQGMGGNDLLVGNEELNNILGDAGSDTLLGLGGDDFLSGGDGDDWLFGGTGADRMRGGLGTDTFVFGFRKGHVPDAGINAARDTIQDFVRGEDVLRLEGIGAEAVTWRQWAISTGVMVSVTTPDGLKAEIFLQGTTGSIAADLVFA
jgi:Ca2+-binding RTX toxin-like protein